MEHYIYIYIEREREREREREGARALGSHLPQHRRATHTHTQRRHTTNTHIHTRPRTGRARARAPHSPAHKIAGHSCGRLWCRSSCRVLCCSCCVFVCVTCFSSYQHTHTHDTHKQTHGFTRMEIDTISIIRAAGSRCLIYMYIDTLRYASIAFENSRPSSSARFMSRIKMQNSYSIQNTHV